MLFRNFLAQTQFEAAEVMVLCADTPLINNSSLCELSAFKSSRNLKAAGLSFHAENPFGYGRIIRDSKKIGISIVEEKDASADQRRISEVNSGIYLIDKQYLIDKASNLKSNNRSNEFYLTDVMDVNEQCDFISIKDGEKIFLGVNTMVQLSQTEKHQRHSINIKHLENGVRLIDPDTTYIGEDVVISSGVTIYPNVHLRGKTIIKENAIIETGTVINNSTIGSLVSILPYSVIDDSIIKNESAVGPFARIRPGSNIGEKCKIGNFVETKKVSLSSGVKVSHLSYVGDAEVGENSNIGCGFITCNYDGKDKHKTKIGKNCFIGSDSQTIAPVNIADNCYIASGSTINKDLSEGDFAISRGRQVVKEGLAKKFIKK